MNARERLDKYIEHCTARLRAVLLARAAALAASAALLLTALGTYLLTHWLFSGFWLAWVQIFLLFAMIALAVVGFRPLRRLVERRTSREIERAIPAFEGRISTYVDNRSGEQSTNPMLELLAADTRPLLDHHTPVAAVPTSRVALPAVAALGCAALLAWLLAAGPAIWKYGAQRLWLGWLPGQTLLPSIVVQPGNVVIPRGGDLTIRAAPRGFASARLEIHARFGQGEWEQAQMRLVGTDERYAFTFVAVREPIEYFISAHGVRSDGFNVDVVDMPTVERIGLTYRYPEWTGLEPRTVMHGGDIRAVKGTQVTLDVVTDQMLDHGVVMVGDERVELASDGLTARADLSVETDGSYFVAALHDGDSVRLTPEFEIAAVADRVPDIELARPGHDWPASPIEEVTTRVRAFDDFAVEALELRYSMNGVDWESVALDVGKNASHAELEHVFYLEDMRQNGAPLRPGDLISYYAVARDHAQSVESDLFFIEVQPYDRRYSEGQAPASSGSGMGNGFDVSNRQREILTATWNLIRDRDRSETERADRARMLSKLQLTLREQALTLVERSRGRMLDVEQDMGAFMENMEAAAEAMVPASKRLEQVALNEAVPPEQSALQHLLRAEASLRDVQISRQSSRNGGGGRMNRDLAELFELEMDPERNQYEMGQEAASGNSNEELDRALQELEELARREERLRNQIRSRQDQDLASRWQQEMLRRDADELRQRLQRLQNRSGTLERALTDLDSAVDAIEQASRSTDGSRAKSAMELASETLNRVSRALSEEQGRMTRSTIADLVERADRLNAEQRDVAERLQHALENALDAAKKGDYLASGLAPGEETELARKKRQMRNDLESLERRIEEAVQGFEQRKPDVAEALTNAIDTIRQSRLQERLAVAEDAILGGAALFVGSNEEMVQDNLEDVRAALARAQQLASAGDAGEGSRTDLLAGIERLRGELDRWNPSGGNPRLPEDELRVTIRSVSDGLSQLGREQGADKIHWAELERVRELARLGQTGLKLNANELSSLQRELRLGLENLELTLRQRERERSGAVAARYTSERDEESDRGDVAEYFRRLSACADVGCSTE